MLSSGCMGGISRFALRGVGLNGPEARNSSSIGEVGAVCGFITIERRKSSINKYISAERQ
jgi:hypothetical protein